MDTPATVPLADFQQNPAEHITRLKATGEPEVLTVDGRPEVVVQSAESYQTLRDEAELAYSLQRIRLALADVEAGRVQSADVVFDELAARFNIGRAK